MTDGDHIIYYYFAFIFITFEPTAYGDHPCMLISDEIFTLTFEIKVKISLWIVDF